MGKYCKLMEGKDWEGAREYKDLETKLQWLKCGEEGKCSQKKVVRGKKKK